MSFFGSLDRSRLREPPALLLATKHLEGWDECLWCLFEVAAGLRWLELKNLLLWLCWWNLANMITVLETTHNLFQQWAGNLKEPLVFSCSVPQVANLLCVLPKSGARRAQNLASVGAEIVIPTVKTCCSCLHFGVVMFITYIHHLG